ncbi:MAG: hypothetical protein COT71_02005 [Candidatus Andersenbacteria bacterium CG10_big_fil_rev_8_21_14_0_10_54_11]|uniref:Peptidoglycan binding domain-containing protein n=1 Tax=Candidatus Andersenbacteria bacterium CG10_big_fil_rev_8_21_14_0_10_54_11 TaxID=1974485 RepID=A0A2M6WZG4_9BACT|nr:MAG: hypothetical protein COT71_02005 [Candidatus Andersenbacteria bacterium CG10_big_fil_rev_8_21_14_0_10_54_11]
MNKSIQLLCTLTVLLILPVSVIAVSPLSQEVAAAPSAISKSAGGGFTLVFGRQTWRVPPGELKKWYKTRAAGDQVLLQLRPAATYDYLNVYVSPKINRPGQTSRFKYVAGNLHLIGPGTKGKIVDGEKTSLAIRRALISGKSSAAVSMKEHRPAVFSAEDFKQLSFPDHLASGQSSFAGSPANRRHNIAVAAARYDGLVLMPGEQFSFNSRLGTVDAANGYLPELVIKENVTTPEYGGGICQVSTTAFRAAMEAGLKITDRHNHSYPVAYYGAPGYDATIYSPNPDLKFVNDTGAPVYLLTKIVGSQLIFDVWGKSDGRQVKINGPYITARLPDGSLTAVVAQLITKGGRSFREQNFVSHYQSPDKFPTVRAANGE